MRLGGAHEVAELLGVSRQRVHQLAAADDFPVPIAELAAGSFWELDEIEDWRGRMRPFNRRSSGAAGEGPIVPRRDPERPQDDPWDANAVRYLLGTPDGVGWSRGVLMECLREQSKWVTNKPEKVAEAARLASQYRVERRKDAGGQTIHFFRSDPGAPTPYPKSDAERRAWLKQAGA